MNFEVPDTGYAKSLILAGCTDIQPATLRFCTLIKGEVDFSVAFVYVFGYTSPSWRPFGPAVARGDTWTSVFGYQWASRSADP